MLNGPEVKRRREMLRMSQADLARRAKVSQPVIADIESGAQRSTKKLGILAKALGCDPSDLDPDFGEEKSFDINGEMIRVPSNGIREIDANAGLGDGQILPTAYSPSEEGWNAVDAYRPDAWVLPHRFLREGFGTTSEHLIAVATQGDSMAPTISHGSVVFIDTRDKKIKSQELYALRDPYGEIIIKRLDLIRDEGIWRVRIQSDNSMTRERIESLDDVFVVGRVKGIFKLL